MGFFSWRCAKTGKPILAGEGTWPDDLAPYTRVVLVTKTGRVEGTYDGYGRIGADTLVGMHIDDVPENIGDMGEEPRLVLAHAYAGEAYDQLEPSGREPNQGWFWDLDELREVVADEYPYPRGFADSSPLAVARTLAAAGLDVAGRAKGGRIWTLRRDRDEVAALIAAHDAKARAAGSTPARDAVCAALRDLRDLLAEPDAGQARIACAGTALFALERGGPARLAIAPAAGGKAAVALASVRAHPTETWSNNDPQARMALAVVTARDGGPAKMAPCDAVLVFADGEVRVRGGIGDVAVDEDDVVVVFATGEAVS